MALPFVNVFESKDKFELDLINTGEDYVSQDFDRIFKKTRIQSRLHDKFSMDMRNYFVNHNPDINQYMNAESKRYYNILPYLATIDGQGVVYSDKFGTFLGRSDIEKIMRTYRNFDKNTDATQLLTIAESYNFDEIDRNILVFEGKQYDFKELVELKKNVRLPYQFYDDAIDDEQQQAIEKFAKYIDSKTQKDFLINFLHYPSRSADRFLNLVFNIYGEGGNGKGLVAKLFKILYADRAGAFQNVTSGSSDFQTMNAVSRMASKDVLIESDSEALTKHTKSLIKKMSSGEPLVAKSHGRDAYEVSIDATIIIETNEAFESDNNEAEKRRYKFYNIVGSPKDTMTDHELDILGKLVNKTNLFYWMLKNKDKIDKDYNFISQEPTIDEDTMAYRTEFENKFALKERILVSELKDYNPSGYKNMTLAQKKKKLGLGKSYGTTVLGNSVKYYFNPYYNEELANKLK